MDYSYEEEAPPNRGNRKLIIGLVLGLCIGLVAGFVIASVLGSGVVGESQMSTSPIMWIVISNGVVVLLVGIAVAFKARTQNLAVVGPQRLVLLLITSGLVLLGVLVSVFYTVRGP